MYMHRCEKEYKWGCESYSAFGLALDLGGAYVFTNGSLVEGDGNHDIEDDASARVVADYDEGRCWIQGHVAAGAVFY